MGKKTAPIDKFKKGAKKHPNGYPFSDNRTLNCKGVAPPTYMKGGETATWYPFELTRCPPPTENPICLSSDSLILRFYSLMH